jgi:hypothetical protein
MAKIVAKKDEKCKAYVMLKTNRNPSNDGVAVRPYPSVRSEAVWPGRPSAAQSHIMEPERKSVGIVTPFLNTTIAYLL